MADEQALGADDYRALHGMLLSDDAATKAQGLALSKKLTSDEQQQFFDYQQSANKGKGELTRVDNTVGGLPPEAAVVSGLGIGRAIAAPGLSLVARGVAGAKAAVGQAAPVVKYELVKSGLSHMGVPAPLAMAGALAVSGYKKGGAKAAATEAPVAAETAPAVVAKPSVSAILSDVELARQEYAAGRLPKSVLDKIETIAARQAAAGATNAAPAIPQPSPAAGTPQAATVARLTDTQPSAVLVAAAPVAASPSNALPATGTIAERAAAMRAENPQIDAQGAAMRAQAIAAKVAAPVEAVAAPFHESKALNELAIMARRAKVTLSPDDYKFAIGEMKNGAPAAEAVAAVVKKNVAETLDPAAAFNQHFGLKTPTEAETRFPKGNRGAPSAS